MINLVSLAMKFITPDMLLKLAGATGLQNVILQKALGAIVPSILGGIVGKAAQPGGADAIMDILGKMDPSILGKLGGMIGGAGQSQLVEQGSGMLSSILGGGTATGLAGAIGKFAGIDQNAAGSLMGMLAPAILGTVGQEARSAKLDAGGLASLLAGQKDFIGAAMPAGLTDVLKSAGLGGSLLWGLGAMASAGATASSVTNAAGSAASSAGSAAQSAATQASSGGGMLKWLIGLAALLALGWWFLGRTPPSTIAVPSFPKIMAGSTDVGGQLTGVLGSLSSTLGTIKDVEAAKTALPKLQSMLGDVDKIGGLAGTLPADGRKALATAMGGAMPGIMSSIDKVMSLPGVAAILKPIIDQLVGKLTGLAKS